MVLTMYEKWIMFVKLLTHVNYSRMIITHALYFINDLWLIPHKYSFGTHDVWIWIMFVKLLTHENYSRIIFS